MFVDNLPLIEEPEHEGKKVFERWICAMELQGLKANKG